MKITAFAKLTVFIIMIGLFTACGGGGGVGGGDDGISNNAPIADAGLDQSAAVSDTVNLDGSGSSDPDGDALTFVWLLTAPERSNAVLSDPTSLKPGFAVDVPGSYVAQLIVNDGIADSLPDDVIINTTNSSPVADAGPDQTVFVDDTVVLNATASTDVDGDPLSFSWSLTTAPTGSMAMLSDPLAVMPTFIIDLPGTYVAELRVNDGIVDSAPDTVTITTQNSVPVADAGPDQSVLLSRRVTLNGSGSNDVDGDPLSMSWALTSVPTGSTAMLSNSTEVEPSFVVDLVGSYVVQLIVNDGYSNSVADTVVITAFEDQPPTAVLELRNAAGQVVNNVPYGEDFILDGSLSADAEGGNIVEYTWILLSEFGLIAKTTRPSINTSVLLGDVILPLGNYQFQLVVTDNGGYVSMAAQVTVIIIDNVAPTARLDARNVGGELLPKNSVPYKEDFILDGSRSVDAGGGNIVSYTWLRPDVRGALPAKTVTSSINVSVLLEGEVLPVGSHRFQLVVKDDSGNVSDPDEVTVTVF